jgi:hypothetical protein
MCVALCSLLTATAWGWPPVTQHFRIGYRPDFDDVGTVVNDDFIHTNAVRPAQFVEVKLLLNGITHDLGVTDEDGIVTFLNVDPDDDYELVVYAHHDFENSGRDFFVRNTAGGIILQAQADLSSPPVATTTTDFVFDAAVPGQEWVNLAVVGSWMIARRPNGWPTFADNGAVYTMVFQPPPNNSSAVGVYYPDDLATYINPNDRGGFASKYVIAHEFAHQLQHWAPYVANPYFGIWDVPSEVDYDAPDDSSCPWVADTHYVVSKEYQSAAILEGMADWIAAVAFNDTTEDNCRLKPYGDYPWLDTFADSDEQYSCQGWDDTTSTGDSGGVEWTGYSIDAFDYLGDYCNAGTMTDRGTELDWMRFFWDLDRENTGGEGMTFAELMDIWAAAEPYQWDSIGTGARPELEAAFDAAGFGVEWDDQDHNGIFR